MNLTDLFKSFLAKCSVCFVFTLFISASIWAQEPNVNIKENNITLKEVFEIIEEQTKLLFAYNETDIDVKRSVSVNAVNKPLLELMAELLKGTNTTCMRQGKILWLKLR